MILFFLLAKTTISCKNSFVLSFIIIINLYSFHILLLMSKTS